MQTYRFRKGTYRVSFKGSRQYYEAIIGTKNVEKCVAENMLDGFGYWKNIKEIMGALVEVC